MSSGPHALARLGRAALGAGAGLLVGTLVVLATVTAKARAGFYLYAVHELTDIGVEIVLSVVCVGLGAMLAYRQPSRLARSLRHGVVGLVGGAVVGAGLGALAWQTDEGAWAGGLIGATLGYLGVAIAAWRADTAASPTLRMVERIAVAALILAVGVNVLLGLRPLPPSAVPERPPMPLPAVEAIGEVVFLMGDGGATVPERTPLLKALQHDVEQWSATLARDSAVSVVYPGDLVYPVGIRDRDHPLFPQDSARLWNQIDLVGGPMARRYATRGLFTPGNHDWGSADVPGGLPRIVNLAAQIDSAQARGIAADLLPAAGAPGPATRDVGDRVRLVFIDTHWFLGSRRADLRAAFLDRLEAILRAAGDRHVLVVAHHPYQTAGPHGALLPGYETLGIEYLLRKTGTLVQDLNAPIYDELLRGLQRAFAAAPRPPLAFIGGHDHSLQVLERQAPSDPAFTLVSGAGSKVSSIGTLPNLAYGAARPGYMMLVTRTDGAIDLFVVAGDPEHVTCPPAEEEPEAHRACMLNGELAFDITYSRTLAEAPGAPTLMPLNDADTSEPDAEGTVARAMADATAPPVASGRAMAWWTATVIPPTDPVAEADEPLVIPPPAVPMRMLYFAPDSVVTTAGASYPVGPVGEAVMGDLNRPLWDLPVRLPVLDLDTLGGGVEVDELTGGMQTTGVRFDGADGVTYQFRSIVKMGTRGLEGAVAEATLGPIFRSQLGALFPFGATVVDVLLEAADILGASPVAVVMPNDDRLGAYRPYLAGRTGWIEVWPNEGGGDTPGFAGSRKIVSGDEIFEELREDLTAVVDGRRYLRARLIDLMVNDWDRHPDNWRWARFQSGDTARWVPIPRDRDWAFSRTGGLVEGPSQFVFPEFVGFSDTYPPLDRLAASGEPLDRRLLPALSRTAFEAEARFLQRTLTDAVLADAVATLPPAVHTHEREPLLRALRARRAALVDIAGAFHDLIADTVHIYGHDGVVDTVRIEALAGDRLRVRAWTPGRAAAPYLDRTLHPDTTRAIRLFVDLNRDVVEAPATLPIPVDVDAGGR